MKLPWGLRRLVRHAYREREMPAPRLQPLKPIPHLSDLDAWIGWWVAVKDGEVVAAGRTAKQLVSDLAEKGIKDATAQYVPEPAQDLKVGLG